MNIVVKTTLDPSQIQGLYQMYLYAKDGAKGTKKDFLDYCKIQVTICGCGEFLLSTDMSNYEDLSMSDVEQLMKWKLIKEEL